MKIYKIITLFPVVMSLNLFAMHHESSNEDIAKEWIEAGYAGKNEIGRAHV